MSGNPYGLFGDPAAIAALMPRVRQIASRLEARSEVLQRTIDPMVFEGPKAAEFRSHMNRARRDAVRISGDIAEISADFLRAAHNEARRIAEWEAAQERLEQGPMP